MASYDTRRAAYDLKKLCGKSLVTKAGRSRRYQVSEAGPRTIAALLIPGDQVLKPLLAALVKFAPKRHTSPKQGRKPQTWRPIDDLYQTLRLTMHALLRELHVSPV